MPVFITPTDLPSSFSWSTVVRALEAGHKLPKARRCDSLLTRDSQAMLNRAAWIDSLGMALKTATVFPDNHRRGLPTVQAAVLLFDDTDGSLSSVLDGIMVTDYKTAADSALCAKLLARPDSSRLLIIGAGRVAGNLARAYAATLPNLREFQIWNRTPERAETLAAQLRTEGIAASAVSDQETALGRAHIIATATMSATAILQGESVRPGTHVDLVGAFTPNMREADDALMRKARIFADCRETALDTGELDIPMQEGIISKKKIIADLYDIIAGTTGRTCEDEITVCKNGGGAHLDLMTARAVLDAVTAAPGSSR